MARHRGSARAGLLLVAGLALGLPDPAPACDAPGVSCSSDETPPAALAPDAGACEAGSVVPPVRPRPRPAFVPLNPNGHNQRDRGTDDLAGILQQLERERAQARSDAHR